AHDGLLGGTARIFAAEALLVPTGLVTAAFLSRRFGPEGYGLLTLASVLVVWVESNVAAALSRPAIKLVGDGDDWRPVGAAVLRLYIVVGLGLALALWAASQALAAALGEPALAGYLKVLALDVPLFCAAQAHRNIIVGLGRFRERALVSAWRWVARLLLVVVFVLVEGSPAGALWGSVCASLVELVVCRRYARPRLFGRGAYPARRLCGYALPLVVSALCVSLYSRLDLIMLKALGGTNAEAGVYGVAQNLALLPTLFSFSFAPALLSTLSRALRDGDEGAARASARQALRAVILLTPLAAITAGAAPEIVGTIFGPEFLAASTPLRLLIFGALALLLVAVTTSVLTAAGKPGWTLHVAWPLLLSAAAGHFFLIPRAGAVGAAFVTTALACVAALVTVCLVQSVWRVAPPAPTLWRSAAVSLSVYALTALMPAHGGLLLVPKLAGAGVVCNRRIASLRGVHRGRNRRDARSAPTPPTNRPRSAG
nr:oligosaccharide flippase family protein [Acidobacteriota bacterium]